MRKLLPLLFLILSSLPSKEEVKKALSWFALFSAILVLSAFSISTIRMVGGFFMQYMIEMFP
ncbi:hypothetical protein [Enterobacter mori]|uniref:hypothetical protein n=1 Tax=Enterobacter mori TaxID=539813 RepID=UPI001B8B1F4B|nr:hypothetical protein [Enterobacter mori]MBS3049707.1 hypothetical protein [Enterobacter mori]